jgi:hypothetical protein
MVLLVHVQIMSQFFFFCQISKIYVNVQSLFDHCKKVTSLTSVAMCSSSVYKNIHFHSLFLFNTVFQSQFIKCICPIAVHRNTPFHSCFDFRHSIDVLHVIQNLRPEPNHQTCKNGTGDAYVRNHKTLCSPAQNPDPQGHSGALMGKQKNTQYFCIWENLD